VVNVTKGGGQLEWFSSMMQSEIQKVQVNTGKVKELDEMKRYLQDHRE
jgi:hypothetical protein